MDVPIGALGDGFEERLVLEEKGVLERGGGCLLYLLMIPFAMVAAYFAAALTVGSFQLLLHFPDQLATRLTGWMGWALLFPAVYLLYREYRSREFREVALRQGKLEVTGSGVAWDSAELIDVKVWPIGLSFYFERGEGLVVRAPEETKRVALEQLLPGLVARQRQILDSTGELRLVRSWRPLLHAILRTAMVGGLLGAAACLASWQVGLGCALLVAVLMLRPLLVDLRGPGLVLTRTGLRRLGDSAEVPWSEVESCWTGDYFQEVLRVVTRRGTFRLVSARNPLVWALFIQELGG